MSMKDKVAIVTGSSRGIGRGIAERLAAEGASVVVNGRHLDSIEPVVESIRAKGGQALPVVADVGVTADVDRLFSETVRAYGGLDVLVNNAAYSNPVAHFLEMDEDHWDRVIRSNLKSVYLCSHRAAKLMVEQGKKGCIISISSFAAARSHRCMVAYDSSKGGIEAFNRAIALDLAPFGIRANAVGPGAIHTDDFEAGGEEAKIERGRMVPLGRVGRSEEVAAAVLFLASDEASYITGQILYVDGGVLAQGRSPQVDRPLPPSVASLLRR